MFQSNADKMLKNWMSCRNLHFLTEDGISNRTSFTLSGCSYF